MPLESLFLVIALTAFTGLSFVGALNSSGWTNSVFAIYSLAGTTSVAAVIVHAVVTS